MGDSLENEEDISRGYDGAHNMEWTIPRKTNAPTADVQDDERTHVIHRYEDTNRCVCTGDCEVHSHIIIVVYRLLGSLVLSRRRTLGSPSIDSQ